MALKAEEGPRAWARSSQSQGSHRPASLEPGGSGACPSCRLWPASPPWTLACRLRGALCALSAPGCSRTGAGVQHGVGTGARPWGLLS